MRKEGGEIMINEEKTKKPIWKRWWVWTVVILFIIIIVSVGGDDNKKTDSEQQSSQEQDQQQAEIDKTIKPTRKEVPYKVIEEEDISYIGCKRVGIRLVVPDDSDKLDVGYTLKKIINSYKSDWDDITIWAYKYSEESQVGKIMYTMGMEEYSICD
ncbi:hypothetical protein KKA24_02270 [Patescibacteria group bacterium]|nr:hypothetical protein [Patescibacteria group bacterium]